MYLWACKCSLKTPFIQYKPFFKTVQMLAIGRVQTVQKISDEQPATVLLSCLDFKGPVHPNFSHFGGKVLRYLSLRILPSKENLSKVASLLFLLTLLSKINSLLKWNPEYLRGKLPLNEHMWTEHLMTLLLVFFCCFLTFSTGKLFFYKPVCICDMQAAGLTQVFLSPQALLALNLTIRLPLQLLR